MMNLIFVHIGEKLPYYFWDNIEQARKFHRDDIYLIIPKKEINKKKNKKYNCKSIAYEDLLSFEKNLSFKRVSWQKKYGSNDLFFTSIQRFFLIEKVMRDHDLSNVIHMENDVCLFTDTTTLERVLKPIFKDCVVICPESDYLASACFIFIDNSDSIDFFNNLILKYLSKGESWAKNNIDNFINDMTLLNYLYRNYPSKIKTFPILPEKEGSKNIDVFHSLFDPGSWGIFMGGTDPKYRPDIGPGYCDINWVGRELAKGRYKIIWRKDEKGRKCPHVNCDNKFWKLNNIHLHCKDIKWFTQDIKIYSRNPRLKLKNYLILKIIIRIKKKHKFSYIDIIKSNKSLINFLKFIKNKLNYKY